MICDKQTRTRFRILYPGFPDRKTGRRWNVPPGKRMMNIKVQSIFGSFAMLSAISSSVGM